MAASKKNHLASDKQNISLARVFSNVAAHQEVAEIMKRHMTNRKDIREFVLEGLNLQNCRQIIDLGCGFGYFTGSLKGKVHRDAEILGIDMHPGYRDIYLQACRETGIKGSFSGKGIQHTETLESNFFDLALCSFSLYFFPEYIREISRILKKEGIFAVITHSHMHMHEFNNYVKKILLKDGIQAENKLPYEKLVENFSGKNGEIQLSEFFRYVGGKEFCNEMIFRKGQEKDFEKYLLSKKVFFLPENIGNKDEVFKKLLSRISKDIGKSGSLVISKNDMAYICTGSLII